MGTVLITGGSGFCALNIADQLLSQGKEVVLYGITAPPTAAMEAFAQHPGIVHTVMGDVRVPEELDSVFTAYPITHVVHTAAITASGQAERAQFQRLFEVNALGAVQVFEAAKRHNVHRVVHLSSGALFGPESFESQTEEDLYECARIAESHTPIPQSLYAITKYAAERAALRYRAAYDLDVVVLRVGVAFGRWEYPTGVRDTLSVPYTLYELAKRGEKAWIGPGLPTDWVYATDVATATVLLLEAKSCQHRIYQVSTGTNWCVREWAQLLEGAFPSFEWVIQPAVTAQTNVGRLAPTPRPPFSIDALQREFGFHPQFEVQSAFEDYLAWRQTQPLW